MMRFLCCNLWIIVDKGCRRDLISDNLKIDQFKTPPAPLLTVLLKSPGRPYITDLKNDAI